MTYDIVENKGIWRFIPEYAVNINDHLPEDAWIPFLKETDSTVMNSTRSDFRPFTVSEQKRLLTVGACLQCHKDESKVMKQTIDLGLDLVLKQRKKTCVLPVFSQ